MNSTNQKPFEFAVGIECTMIVDEKLSANPPLRRLEQFELMRHYEHWREDLDLVAKLVANEQRVSKLRWCLPWYRIEASPGKFDFDWTDRFVERASELNIELVPDIVHYGTPDWLPNAFLERDYVDHVAQFANVCAARYKSQIKYYTPFNEPAMAGIFGALKGEWPPYLSDVQSYTKVLIEIALGMQETTKAIKTAAPAAECWAVEVINNHRSADDRLTKRADEDFRRDLLCWDLVHGLVNPKHEFYSSLIANGIAPAKLEQLVKNAVSLDLLGVNFYPWSAKKIERKNSEIIEVDEEVNGSFLFDILKKSHEHTKAELFVTETSAHGGGGPKSSSVIKHYPDMRIQWMDETLDAVAKARREGIPVRGYTYFPLFTMVDWAYRTDTVPATDYFLNLGIVEVAPKDFSRNWTPAATHFLERMRTFEASKVL